MNNLNRVAVTGNVVRDASEGVKHSAKDGTAYGEFTIAVGRSKKDGDNWVDSTSFFDVHGFGKSYENAVRHMTKGSSVTIDGWLEQRKWTGKDGAAHSKIIINADKIYPSYSKRTDGAGNEPSARDCPAGMPPATPESFPEDLPF